MAWFRMDHIHTIKYAQATFDILNPDTFIL